MNIWTAWQLEHENWKLEHMNSLETGTWKEITTKLCKQLSSNHPAANVKTTTNMLERLQATSNQPATKFNKVTNKFYKQPPSKLIWKLQATCQKGYQRTQANARNLYTKMHTIYKQTTEDKIKASINNINPHHSVILIQKRTWNTDREQLQLTQIRNSSCSEITDKFRLHKPRNNRQSICNWLKLEISSKSSRAKSLFHHHSSSTSTLPNSKLYPNSVENQLQFNTLK